MAGKNKQLFALASILFLPLANSVVAEPLPSPDSNLAPVYTFTLTATSYPFSTIEFFELEPQVTESNPSLDSGFIEATNFPNLPPGAICACYTIDLGTPIDDPVTIPNIGPIFVAAVPEAETVFLFILVH